MSHIISIGFAPDNIVHVWYDDGTESAGTPSDFGASAAPQPYTTAPGKSRYDIRAMGIAKSTGHVYTWFTDGTFIEGTPLDLDAHGGPTAYTVPAGWMASDRGATLTNAGGSATLHLVADPFSMRVPTDVRQSGEDASFASTLRFD